MTVWATRADQVDLRGPNPHDLARSHKKAQRKVKSPEATLERAEHDQHRAEWRVLELTGGGDASRASHGLLRSPSPEVKAPRSRSRHVCSEGYFCCRANRSSPRWVDLTLP